MTFETLLIAQFEKRPELQTQHPAIWGILNGRHCGKRTRRIARMELEARTKLGMSSDESFDWGSIDWLLVVQWIGAILGIIMLIF